LTSVFFSVCSVSYQNAARPLLPGCPYFNNGGHKILTIQ
jgi:hypothetical protein